MYFHGMFTSQQFQEAGQADLDDLDFFPYPDFGTQYDAEKALDAPIDGFALSKAPKNLEAAKAFVEHLAQPETQVAWVTTDVSNIAASKDADTSGYTALQKKAAEVIGGAQRITQFLDRDTNPNFAGPNGMQAFLLDFLQNPDQDVPALQKKIQDFWDTLPQRSGRLDSTSRGGPSTRHADARPARRDRRAGGGRRFGATAARSLQPAHAQDKVALGLMVGVPPLDLVRSGVRPRFGAVLKRDGSDPSREDVIPRNYRVTAHGPSSGRRSRTTSCGSRS